MRLRSGGVSEIHSRSFGLYIYRPRPWRCRAYLQLIDHARLAVYECSTSTREEHQLPCRICSFLARIAQVRNSTGCYILSLETADKTAVGTFAEKGRGRGQRSRAEVVGRGQRFTERHVKDTISVPMCSQGAKRSHPLRLVSISYGFHTSCHGRGREFASRRARHSLRWT